MFGVEEEEIPQAEPPFVGIPDADIAPHIDEIVQRLERPERRFPIERAILISLVVHILLLIAFILAPPGRETRESRAARLAAELEERPVPIKYFVEAPGPASRETRKNAPLSDKTRRASGGDRSRPKSESPFVPPSSGMEGLRPGERSRAMPSGAPRRPAAASPGSSAPAAPRGESIAGDARRGLVVPRGEASGAENGRGKTASGGPDLHEAIREATGNPFAGQGGAPHANPGGGFVDYGPISFDTQGYDWGDYAEEMLRKIKVHWYEQIPRLFEMGPDGELTIRFYIRADGTVEEERVVRTSGVPPYDHAAFMGIADSNPFRPLPKDLHEDREGVTITFKYIHYREDQLRPHR
jgi:TonB family protein